MARRLDIGVASYGNSEALKRTLSSIHRQSQTNWRCFVIDNPGPDPKTRDVIRLFADSDSRFAPIFLEENGGYAGAVNKLFELAETEYIAYCDNDIQIQYDGWDEEFCKVLDCFHEVGIVFPNGGFHAIKRNGYQEVLWACGFCWILNRVAMADIGKFDEEIGHQEEADYCLRLRMNGYRCAAVPRVRVEHMASATNNPVAIERINRGVINFVNKWCRYFCGKHIDYHSPNVLRWEDWPPNALYLEEWWKNQLNGLNDNPEQICLDGTNVYDLIKVPRIVGMYRGRIV